VSERAASAGAGPRRGRAGFATRLLVAQVLVLVAGAMTSWFVASAVGPSLFHEHLQRAGVVHAPAEAAHVEAAFASATIISLLVALLASILMALAVTWYITRRVQRSLTAVADSASEIAGGRYGSRIPSTGLGGEFNQLAATFNQLAERLETVEITRRRLLADLAHEMRTPLATIGAYLEALEDGVRDLDDSTLAVLHSSTHRLGRLAEDISAVSRAEEGKLDIHPVPTDPRELIQAASRVAKDSYQTKGVALVAEPAVAATVSVDPERMAQVLGNLLENALRHTPRGGTVTLTCRSVDGTWVEITVTDSGEGISREHLIHVFDRFYRVDSARNRGQGGSGIGLTIARALVEVHGGRIRAYSPGRGRGAAFTVRLPVAAR
jgi:two-component system sensor histidine kinase BaeS